MITNTQLFILFIAIWSIYSYIAYRTWLTYFYVKYAIVRSYKKDRISALKHCLLGPFVILVFLFDGSLTKYGITFRKKTLIRKSDEQFKIDDPVIYSYKGLPPI